MTDKEKADLAAEELRNEDGFTSMAEVDAAREAGHTGPIRFYIEGPLAPGEYDMTGVTVVGTAYSVVAKFVTAEGVNITGGEVEIEQRGREVMPGYKGGAQ